MKTTLYLIRHGETDWNASHRWQGHADIPLNQRGLHQAKLVAQQLQAEGVMFDAIYSSDLRRAYQTAWQIGALLHIPVQMLPPLREIDVGAWSGLTRSEIEARFPEEMRLIAAGHDVSRGGGETSAAFFQRVTKAMEAMLSQHLGHTLAFVTHGGVVRAITNYVQAASDQPPLPRDHIGNTAITVIEISASRRRVVRFNDVQHLAAQDATGTLVSAYPDDAELEESV